MHLDIKAFIYENIDSTPNHIAVAVSGGPDSMFLCSTLNKWAQEKNCTITALIVDHKLRPESTKEAGMVSDTLSSYGINCKILTWEHNGISSNVQAKARAARYKLLTTYCKEHAIEHLFLGHTLDDQAETIMMRIFRGTGIDGLRGIAEKSLKNGVHILRPLLHIRKHQILDSLAKQNISYVIDPSNSNDKFDRIKVRKILSMVDELYHESQAQDIFHRFNLLASNCSRSFSYISKRVESAINKYVSINKQYNFAIINPSALKLHSEVKLRLFASVLESIAKPKTSIRLKSLLLLIESIETNKVMTLAGCEIHLRKEGIIIFEEAPKSKKLIIKDGMHYGLLTQDAIKQLKASGRSIPELPMKKILLVQPAVYKPDGTLLQGLGYKL